LVLACGLLLAAPQGWCCLLALQPPQTVTDAAAAAAKAPAKPAGCSGCCQHQTPPRQAPTKVPSAPPPRCCFGIDRLTLLPSASAVEKADLGFAFPVAPPPVSPPPGIGAIGEVASVVHPPTPHLHVFKCLWLC
jgi:hypothetical protein